ncbi:MAG: hypothetical protein ACOCZ5_00740 [bacterium]
MDIFVLPKQSFDAYLTKENVDDENVENYPLMFISINDSEGRFSQSHFKREHPNVLILHFDDVSKDGEPSPTNDKNTRAFNDEDADRIIEFIQKNEDKVGVLIHCAAGISRSGAVGQFLVNYFEEDMDEFFRQNYRVIPNAHILSKLNSRMWSEKFKK